MFVFVVGVAVGTLSATGVVVGHAAQLAEARMPSPSALLETALWYGGWTALFIVPFAAIGLVREVRRYAAARRALGERAWLDASGLLRSEDGAHQVPLRG